MKKVIHIVGPTAVGKTSLAFDLAQKFSGELVSADSIQIYKKLDIISGKDIPKNSQFDILPQFKEKDFNVGYFLVDDVRIYLLDVVEPTVPFSVSQFKFLAEKIIDLILSKNKLSIVVGGTGLYVKSLIDEISTISIKPDLKLRASLEGLNIKELKDLLSPKKLDSMNNSDKNNKRRLIRSIEIEKSGVSNLPNNSNGYKHLQIGLMAPREFLKEKIEKRVMSRLENGALEEAKSLFKNYDNLSQQVKDANGYMQLFGFLRNEISLEDAIEKWKITEYQHAKRQMTWFLKDKRIKWFDVAKKGFEAKIKVEIDKFLS